MAPELRPLCPTCLELDCVCGGLAPAYGEVWWIEFERGGVEDDWKPWTTLAFDVQGTYEDFEDMAAEYDDVDRAVSVLKRHIRENPRLHRHRVVSSEGTVAWTYEKEES